MANLLDQFKSKVQGAAGRITDFTSDITSSGDFKAITNFDVIIRSWSNLLQTPRRSYIDDPEYGSDLKKFLFYPADSQTIKEISREIKSRILIYDNRAKIENINVRFLQNKKGFIIDITVKYEGDVATFSVPIISTGA